MDILDSAQQQINSAANQVNPGAASAPPPEPPPTPMEQSTTSPTPPPQVAPPPVAEPPNIEEPRKESMPAPAISPPLEEPSLPPPPLQEPIAAPEEKVPETPLQSTTFGAPPPKDESVEPQASTPTPPPKKGGIGKGVIIAGLFLLLATLPVAVFYVSKQQQQIAEIRSSASLCCEGGVCNDNFQFGRDENSPQANCGQRAQEACANHGGLKSGAGQCSGTTTSTGGTTGGSGSCSNGTVPNGGYACASLTSCVQCVSGQYQSTSLSNCAGKPCNPTTTSGGGTTTSTGGTTTGIPDGQSSGCCTRDTQCVGWFGVGSTCDNPNGACASGKQCRGGGGAAGTTSSTCAGPGKSCNNASCCSGQNLVCQGLAGNLVCQQTTAGQCPGGTCTGYIGFKCSQLSNGVCQQNPQDFTSFSAAATYAGSCGQADQVCIGGTNNRHLCGNFTIFSSGCSSSPPPSATHTPTPVPLRSQCLRIKIYKGTTAVEPTTLKANDQVLLAVGGANATKGRIRVNGGAFTVSTTKNAKNEFTVPFTVPTDVTSFTIEAELLGPDGKWR